VLVRTWNLFHGNTLPPGRKRYVEQMVRLVVEGDPDAVCLQEVPPWALGRLAEWGGGMHVYGEVAARPSIGPIPVTREIGRWVTDHNAGLFRSGFEGQANAILVRERILARHVITLNPVVFRLQSARRLRLPIVTQLAWAKERRQAIAVRLESGAVVCTLHASNARDLRITEAEVEHAAQWAGRLAGEKVCVVAGDLNVDTVRSEVFGRLAGFSAPGPGVDHVLVRGADVADYERWDRDRRLLRGLVLSDHAPVEARVV
jgi:endonuclease/exonuclease/phosphatase family metal-dependent hydrolase